MTPDAVERTKSTATTAPSSARCRTDGILLMSAAVIRLILFFKSEPVALERPQAPRPRDPRRNQGGAFPAQPEPGPDARQNLHPPAVTDHPPGPPGRRQ